MKINVNKGRTYFDKLNKERKIDFPYDMMLEERRSLSNPGGKDCAYFDGGIYHFQKFFNFDVSAYKYFAFHFNQIYKKAIIKLNGEVIKENLIRPSFRSIICLENNEIKIYGYQVKFKVLYDKFKSLDDLKKDAKINNNTKEIFSLCLKTAIPSYLTFRENFFTKLYIPINLNEIQYALLSIPYVERSNQAHLVFVLDINEFLDLEDLTPAINIIKDVQRKGHEVAVRCINGGFKIKTELGQVIDSFFVDLNLEENVKADSKSYIASHPFLDRLYQFHKPIIEVNAKSFSEVELLYRSGLTYFSSDAIQGYTEMIDKLDKKIIKKLTNLINNN